MPLARPRRARIALLLLVPAFIAWMVTAACGSGGSDAVGADASADGRPDTSFDAGYVAPEEDATPRDATSGKDAALPPPYCPAPVACADAGTSNAVLAQSSDVVEGIAADGCDVYFGDQAGTIRSVPRCGGLVKTIATGEPYPVIALTVDAWSVYWTAGGVIRRASKAGGPIDTLASDPSQQPWAIAVDDAFVYWTDNHGFASRLWRVPLAGGAPVEVAVVGGGGSEPYGMALDNGRVFFATDQIRSALTDGSAPVDLGGAGTVNDLWCIAVNDTDVYYTRYAAGVVMRVPKTGGDASVFAPAVAPRCVVVDNGNAYWVNDAFSDGGGLTRAPTDGGPATAISKDPGGTAGYRFVALDDAYVYWGFANRVWRAPK